MNVELIGTVTVREGYLFELDRLLGEHLSSVREVVDMLLASAKMAAKEDCPC
jgi:hypothetical protein